MLMDQVYGAYVGFFMEALYPKGLPDEGDSEAKGYGLKEVSSIVSQYLPHHNHNDRMKRFMEKRRCSHDDGVAVDRHLRVPPGVRVRPFVSSQKEDRFNDVCDKPNLFGLKLRGFLSRDGELESRQEWHR